jgi:DNA polymerase I-like protein with 3'-5' exonuclease and polymerase domains
MEEAGYRLIADAAGVAPACEELSRQTEVGFDTETTSLSPFDGRLRLVQLASDEAVYIFDLDKLAPGGDAARVETLEPLRRLLSATRPVKVAHNCLAGDMLVSMADGTKARIDKLVRAKTRGKVLCIDEQTGTVSTGEIVDWVDGGIRPWDDWLRIRMRGKGVLRVTKDHEILTERGRIRAENLLIGDKVLTSLPELSQPQRDMLYGSLLGDGSLTKQMDAQARAPHFKVSHSLRQEGYVALKAAALDGLVKHIKTEKLHYRGFSNNVGGSQLISLTTKSDPRLFELYDDCLMGGKRTLTPGWLDNLSMPAIAVWYCDDGNLSSGSSARICISAFGAEGANTLVEFLRSKGFPAKLWIRPDGQLYVKVVGPYGRGMSEELKRFWENIASCVPASMQYKLPVAYKHLASDKYWTTPHTQSRAFSDSVVEISPLLNDSSERGRYDGYRRGKRRGIRQYCLAVGTHHNFVAGGLAVSNCKFDAKWAAHRLGVELGGDYDSRANDKVEVERGGLFDTLLASQLISAGEQEDRHSLASVVERYLDQTVDKTQQLSDWSGELSHAQLEYAARDAALMLPLRARLVDALRANSLTRTAQLEFECVAPLAALELTGVYLDQQCWRAKLKEIERRRDELHEELQDELAEESAQQSFFGPTRADINLDSHVQLTRALVRIGVPVPDSTRNWKLEPLAAEFPVVGRILEYRTLQKTLKFGETLLESINEDTERIHPHFHQIGAPTGRMSCTDPNVQQIPHAFDMRRCFRAPEGRKLVVADYSQIELRILADFTGDSGFVEAFRSGADLHRVTAAQVFGVALESVTKEQRDFAKRLNFGVVYGIGARRFALMTGLSQEQSEDLLRRYFATYRGLDVWLRDAAQKALRERTAPRTVAGRLFRFNFDPEDKQAASLAQRGGKNSPIQGSSADIIKRALRLLHDRLKGTGASIVNVVHDEIVVETNAADAEETARIVEKAMCDAGEEYVRKVPVKVEATVADEWVK